MAALLPLLGLIFSGNGWRLSSLVVLTVVPSLIAKQLIGVGGTLEHGFVVECNLCSCGSGELSTRDWKKEVTMKILWAALVASWLVIGGLVYLFFFKGSVATASDGRTAIILEQGEKDFILTEMRGFFDVRT